MVRFRIRGSRVHHKGNPDKFFDEGGHSGKNDDVDDLRIENSGGNSIKGKIIYTKKIKEIEI